MNSKAATGSRAIPAYVTDNLNYYLDREAEGDSEASKKILEISNRWGF